MALLSCCLLSLPFYKGASLPSPSATQGVAPSPTTLVATQPTTIPEGVYHNPFPLQTPMNDLPETLVGLWHRGLPMDLLIYIDQDEFFTNYHRSPSCHIRHIILGQLFDSLLQNVSIPLTTNAKLYAHIFLTRTNATIHPEHTRFNPNHIVYKRHVLTKYYPSKHTPSSSSVLLHSLYQNNLPKKIPKLDQISSAPSLIPYWQEKVTISIVMNNGNEVIPKSTLHPATLKYIPLETSPSKTEKVTRTTLLAGSDSGHRIGFYRPIIFPNDFWLLQQHAYPVNENATHLPLTIQVEPIDLWKFNTLAVFEDISSDSSGGMDLVKSLLLNTNPVWLLLLLLQNGLYCILSLLAFRSEIIFWKNKTNSTGISLFGMVLQLIGHMILVLNMANTLRTSGSSMNLLLTQCFFMVIQAWKVYKILPVDWIQHTYQHHCLTPSRLLRLYFTEKNATAILYGQKGWRIKWIGIILVGSVCSWYIWSFAWQSLVLQSLSKRIIRVDYLFLLPQAIKNHRQKKVEHISRKTLMYRSINILIDTMLAIAIKPNFIHCLACIHEDIIYLVILYQYSTFYTPPSLLAD